MPIPQPAVSPILNHPKYERIQDLSSGSFGFVQVRAGSFLYGVAWLPHALHFRLVQKCKSARVLYCALLAPLGQLL